MERNQQSNSLPEEQDGSTGAVARDIHALRRSFFLWGIVIASLLLTSLAWYFTKHSAERRSREQFDFRTNRIEADIRDRLLAYEHMLRGGIGLFQGSEKVTRDEWKLYVDALHINQHYPGIQGLGFAAYFKAAEKEAHVAQMRAELESDYRIYPSGDRPEYTSIIYLEPFDWRNQRAFGYDMFSEPVRRAAMIRARDTGRVAMSGRVTLVQEDGQADQPGFLVYLPLYSSGSLPLTVAERRRELEGYVYGPFRMYDLMNGILADDKEYVELTIYDGDVPDQEALLYQGNSTMGREPLYQDQSLFQFGEHRWLLAFRSSDYFESHVDLTRTNVILGLGIVISLLIAYTVFVVEKLQRKTLELAALAEEQAQSNQQLTDEICRRKNIERQLTERASELDDFNAAMLGREDRVIELKEEINALCQDLGRDPAYPPVWKESLTAHDPDAE